MSVNVANLSGGAAYLAFNGVNIDPLDSVVLRQDTAKHVLESALYGKFDQIPLDDIVKLTMRPRYYDTAQIATLFPYIGGAPGIGGIFGGGNVAASVNSSNGDITAVNNAFVHDMPTLTLGMDKSVMGPLGIWGLCQSGMDPSNAAAYTTTTTGNGFALPAIPNTALIGQQEYSVTFAATTSMTFQAQETWEISHELEWQPVVIQGRTRAFRLLSYRAMAKCTPADTTMAKILSAFGKEGGSALYIPGTRLSLLAKSGVPVDLVFAGTQPTFGPQVTLKAAGIETAGFIFGAKELRPGEIGFVSSRQIANNGTAAAPLTLS